MTDFETQMKPAPDGGHTLTVHIPNADAFGSKVQGEWLAIDLAKVHNSWIVQLLMKGAQRQVNDNAKGDSSRQKLEVGREIVKEITSGKPMPLRNVRASQVPPVTTKARKLAHAAIREWLAANGKDVKAGYMDKKTAERVAMQDAWIKRNPALVETAQRFLDIEAEEKAALANMPQVDVADIFG